MLNLGVLSFLLVVVAHRGLRWADVWRTSAPLGIVWSCCPFGEPRAAWRIAAPDAAASSRQPTTSSPRRRHAARAAPRAALRTTLAAPGFAYVAQYVRRSWRHAQNGPHVAGARCGARHGGGDAKGYCRAPGRARARRGAPPRRAVAHGCLGVRLYSHRAPRVIMFSVNCPRFLYLARRRRARVESRPLRASGARLAMKAREASIRRGLRSAETR